MEEKTHGVYVAINSDEAIESDHINEDFIGRNCSGMFVMTDEQLYSDPICARFISSYLIHGMAAKNISVIAGENIRAPSAIAIRAQKRIIGTLLLPQDCRSSILSYLNIADGIVNEQNRRQANITDEIRDLESVRRSVSGIIERHHFIAQPLRCAAESIDARLAELRSTSYLTSDEIMRLAEALIEIQRALAGKWHLPSTSILPKANDFAAVYTQRNIHRSIKAELLQALHEAQVR